MTDWGRGEYEATAKALEPAAEMAVAELSVEPGHQVLDVACGTGNAALLAARAGARAVGLDAAARLVAVARERAAAQDLDARFVEGDATALPFDDDAFDAAVSVFGVIFADAQAAAQELLRVVRPGGRIVLTTWVPSGPIHESGAIVGRALGSPARPLRWSDPDVVRAVFAPHEVQVREEPIAFSAASPEAYLSEQRERHPMWLEASEPLRRAGVEDRVSRELLELFTQANEDPAAFRVTSRYFLATVTA